MRPAEQREPRAADDADDEEQPHARDRRVEVVDRPRVLDEHRHGRLGRDEHEARAGLDAVAARASLEPMPAGKPRFGALARLRDAAGRSPVEDADRGVVGRRERVEVRASR